MKKVLVAIPSYTGNLNIELIKFLDNFPVPEGRGIGKAYVTRTPIHMARNMLLKKMIDDGYDKLICIDDDEYPIDKDCFLNLLLDDKDMVSGIVRLRTKKENLNILYRERYKAGEKGGHEGMWKYVNYQTIPNKGLFKIDNAGCGLVCISKRVAEVMLSKYVEPFEQKSVVYVKLNNGDFEEFGYNKDDVYIGKDGKPILCRRTLSEDYLFFERAIAQGFELRADSSAGCVHLGEQEKIYPMGT